MIRGGNSTVWVSDMDRAIRFYTETLGLKLRLRRQDRWATIDAGDGNLVGLHPSREGTMAAGQRGSICVGFEVSEPLEEVVATLESRGVRFEGGIREDEDPEVLVRIAPFTDLDGNELYLFEYKADRRPPEDATT